MAEGEDLAHLLANAGHVAFGCALPTMPCGRDRLPRLVHLERAEFGWTFANDGRFSSRTGLFEQRN